MTTRHLWESLCIINMVVHRVFHSVIYNWRKDKDFLQISQEFIMSFFIYFYLVCRMINFLLFGR